MASAIIIEDQVEIPGNLASLADFRRWALSDEFPEHGRIDYINGRIEVDMSPEDFFTHGTLKVELVRVLANCVTQGSLGHLTTDSTRVSSPSAKLSAEPDIVFLSHTSVESGRVRLVPVASKEPGRYIEVEGAPDLVVEIVSNSSVSKDLRRLPKAYLQAGVQELWLVDARGAKLTFQIHRRNETAFKPVSVDAKGFQASNVMGHKFRLTRRRDKLGHWCYELMAKQLSK